MDALYDWHSNDQSLSYWHNVSLDTGGPRGTVAHNDNFTYSQMMKIWGSANETQSHVMMVWWEPDVIVEKYYDLPGDFFPVEIYKPTVECID